MVGVSRVPSGTEKQLAQKSTSSVKDFINSPAMQKKIQDLLHDRAPQFTTSVLSLVGADAALAECQPASLFSAALTAASLDLPINKNLGFAHIIAYKNNKAGITEAQFQIGWKGLVQLAQRSGQYKTIKATAVYEGQLVSEDPLGENVYDWNAKTSNKIIGYVSRFALITGFVSELYMPVEQMEAHGKQYSQSYKRGFGPWVDNFDAMAMKTVIKLNINKFGPMNTQIERAIEADQAVIRDDKVDYIDGVELDVNASDEQKQAIIDANTVDEDYDDNATPNNAGK
jgi:recombination protein RecT